MPRILLLATTTGYQTRAFGDAAERLGVDLVFATDRCHVLDDPWRDDAVPVRFYDEPASVAAILDSAKARPIDGVLAVGDRTTVISARVSEALGLPGHPPAAATVARNKQRTRERLRDAGLPVPWFVGAARTANPSTLAASVSYPCVVKPLALSGSRGVIRADDPAGFAAAFARLRAILESPAVSAERDPEHERVLIEGFIPGREYAVEGLMHHGMLQVLAVFDKPEPLDGPFFEETIYVTPSPVPAAEETAIVDAVGAAAHAIGLRHGPIHAECRVNGDGVFVLEVAARPIGGLCARALRFGVGVGSGLQFSPPVKPVAETANRSRPQTQPVSLEELLLRHALGESTTDWRREADASGVMMIPIPRRGIFRRVSGLEAARAVPGIDDVRITAKPDQVLVPLPEGASYLGFIFARAATAADATRALRRAHARLIFDLDAELPIVSAG